MTTRILVGDCRERLNELEPDSIQCVVTSPPYLGQRDYGMPGEIGSESTVEAYVSNLRDAFRQVWRVLRDDGVLWLNIGDGYHTDSPVRSKSAESFSKEWDPAQTASRGGQRRSAARSGTLKNKDLMGLPWRVALALQDDGWWLRCDVVWEKPNTLPEGSVRDRPTRNHEYLFLLTKAAKYAYYADAIREPYETWEHSNRYAKIYELSGEGQPGNQNNAGIHSRPGNPSGKNRRSVWKIATVPGPGFHFATFPPELAERCVLSGSREGDVVLDPFSGSGTVGKVCGRLDRDFIGVELNPETATKSGDHITGDAPMFADVTVESATRATRLTEVA